MATPAFPDSSTEKPTPVITTGVLASEVAPAVSTAPDTLAPTPTVASTIASVSGVIEQQMAIVAITADLRRKLVPILPGFSISTGIDGTDQVGEFAQMVDHLNTVRKSRAELRV